jgi:hypothetical protein
MNRLESLSPDLATKLLSALPTSQRKACLVACGLAVERAKVEHPIVRESLQRLRDDQAFTNQEKAKLDALVAEMDDRYLTLQEAANPGSAPSADSLHSFATARAVAAVSFASKGDSEALMEAIYEAAAAVGDDKQELFSLIESAIK